jgi:hypothetical protein
VASCTHAAGSAVIEPVLVAVVARLTSWSLKSCSGELVEQLAESSTVGVGYGGVAVIWCSLGWQVVSVWAGTVRGPRAWSASGSPTVGFS